MNLMMIVGRRFEVVGGVDVSFGRISGQLDGDGDFGKLVPLQLSLRLERARRA
jgi:hypothetical protein